MLINSITEHSKFHNMLITILKYASMVTVSTNGRSKHHGNKTENTPMKWQKEIFSFYGIPLLKGVNLFMPFCPPS